MALLQISEPGQSPDPHQRRVVVGIDLGTTHSLVAAVRHGVAECLPDAAGRVMLPSAVRYLAPSTAGSERQVGDAALANQLQDPANTVVSVKRLMGRVRHEVAHVDSLPYTVLDRPGMATIATAAGEKTPVEVSAEILATLRQRAEDTFDDDLFGAVITVPAYFDDAQRQATKDAAQMAGIHVMRLINEPTAAAIAYGLDNQSAGTFAVFDLGGGTFDISILKLTEGVFEVVATGGDSALGGDDYDRALLDAMLQRAGKGNWVAHASAVERATLQRLARRIKEALSDAPSDDLSVSETVTADGATFSVSATRRELAEATAHLTARTLGAVRKAMR
ncbi:MAG: Hsp70 family protein, partial [Burkholderiaceae bacterium]|nr:Hsp70 family protein [Burkholderiaceae bacterium]